MNAPCTPKTSVHRSRVRACVALLLIPLSAALGAWPYGPPGQMPYPGGPPQGQPPTQQGPGAWQFRPQPPSNAEGTPPKAPPSPQPGYAPFSGPQPAPYPGQAPQQPPGAYPGQYPGPYPGQYPGPYPGGYPGAYPGGAPASQATAHLEVTLDEPESYLQQPLLVRVALITSDNPSEATLELPATGDALLQRLSGPTPRTRDPGQARREIVHDFVLTLIPLRAGTIEVPPLKVVGSITGYGGARQRFEAVADGPIRLQVRPAVNAVTPWLPLKSLSLTSDIDREESLVPGQPVTLSLTLSATGGTVGQLPSLEEQLATPDLRVYREQVLTEGGLTPDQRELFGRRTEFYTLVPQSPGRLVLPEISVTWWNTNLGVREVVRLPMRTLQIGGTSGPLGFSTLMTNAGSSKVWLPLAGIILLVGGYWAGVFYGTRAGRSPRARGSVQASPGRQGRVAAWARALAAELAARWTRATARLRPGPAFARLRAASLDALPASSRFLMCVRHANQANDPVAWSDRFEADARSRLRFQGDITQPNLIKLILNLRPNADPAALTRLMRDLDAALYGGRDAIDFARWKRDFMRQVGRGAGLRRRAGRASPIKRAALPALNPGR